jgi:hypothetical protein
MSLFEPVIDNLIGVLHGAADGLDRSGRVPHVQMESALAALRDWSARDAATLWYSLPLAEGIR